MRNIPLARLGASAVAISIFAALAWSNPAAAQ